MRVGLYHTYRRFLIVVYLLAMNRVFQYLTLVIFVTLIYVQLTTSTAIPRVKRQVRESSDDTSDSGLYYNFDKAMVLNNTNFNQELFQVHKDKLWLVEFYNHWCGYCIRFVPVFKSFAYDVYEWRDIVRIGTIDCANSINNDICRKQDIKKVPSTKIFPPNSNSNFVGVLFGKGSETSIVELREGLVQKLKSYQHSQENISGPVNLKLLRHDNLERLWSEIPPTVLYVVLVFEPKDSLVGSQMALDISRTPEARVRLVDPKNKNLTRLAGMEEGGTGAVIVEKVVNTSGDRQRREALLISSTGVSDVADVTEVPLQLSLSAPLNKKNPFKFTHLPVENFTREGLNIPVRKFLIDRGVNIAPKLPEVPVIHTNVSVEEIKKALKWEKEMEKRLNVTHLSTVVFQMDLEAALVYSMTNEIALKRNFTSAQKEALKNFLTVLIKYFPTGEQGKNLFTELKKRELDDKDFVSGGDISKTFKELVIKYNPFKRNLVWVGCRGTIPSLRGYPCSLWTLFHTLIAQEELHDRDVPDEKHEALDAMVGYIRNFFSCSQCAEHFNQMAKTIPGTVKSQRDAVMWLWKAHNTVNRRLAGDETEDPTHHKIQFPTRGECPACHTADGSWDESAVFPYLSNMYTRMYHM